MKSSIFLFSWTLSLFLGTLGLPDTIRVGGLFDPNDQRQELAFRYAVESVNADRGTLSRSRLHAQIDRLPADDSFHASKKVCQLLRMGVAGIFGPQSENTANHVQSICDALEVPHIETRWDYKRTRDAYSLNLYPHPSSMGKAYYDVIKKLGWKSFVILYDSNEGLVRLQSLLKGKGVDWSISIRQLPEGEDWRPLLKEIRKTSFSKFVIEVAQDKIYRIMKQASQIGLMREYHSYFITSLDMHLVDIEDFRYGGTNITALRIIDPEKPEVKKVVEEWMYGELRYGRTLDPETKQITTESALMHDAVHLFARALDDLDMSREVDISPLYCEGDKTWQNGNSLINYMKWYSSRRYGGAQIPSHGYSGRQGLPNRSGGMGGIPGAPSMGGMPNMAAGMPPINPNFGGRNEYSMLGMMNNMTAQLGYNEIQVYGLTGLIKFDTEGFRTDFQLEITELDSKLGIHNVGLWTLEGGANYTRSAQEAMDAVSKSLQNRTLIVTTALAKPYTMLKQSSVPLQGNNRFEGFCIDLIKAVAEILKFNYTFQLVGDDSYGSKDKETGEWNGMIRELLDHKADLAIVDFTITYSREEAVDFSMPFMNLGISIVYKKPQKKAPSLFSFMSPFSIDVWIYMATAYLGVSVLLFILARMTPAEWDSPYPCIEDPDELENCFTLLNSLWFIIATFLCQGADIAPRAISTRIVAGIWWFFTLIMISSYTANLAAFLTVERMDSPIEGAEDLAKQTKIKYGSKEGGSTYSFFKESKIPTYQRMWAAMSNARPTVFTPSNDEGVKRVQNSDGMYAFMMESSTINYVVERKCDLMQVGGLLDSKSYGIALPPGSPYTGYISSAILRLKENGDLHTLYTKWWKRRGGGQCTVEGEEDAASAAELGLDNVGGVFVVMAGGGAAACVCACFEFMWKARKFGLNEGENFWDELFKELKFIARCGDNSKPVRKTKSPDTESTIYSSSTFGYLDKK